MTGNFHKNGKIRNAVQSLLLDSITNLGKSRFHDSINFSVDFSNLAFFSVSSLLSVSSFSLDVWVWIIKWLTFFSQHVIFQSYFKDLWNTWWCDHVRWYPRKNKIQKNFMILYRKTFAAKVFNLRFSVIHINYVLHIIWAISNQSVNVFERMSSVFRIK